MPGKILVMVADPDGAIRRLNHHCKAANGHALADLSAELVWMRLPAPEFAESIEGAWPF